MTKSVFTLFLLSLCMSIPLQAQSDSIATLEIEFTGIRSTEGEMALNICNSPDGFPRKPCLEIQYPKDLAKDGVLVIEIDSLNYGTYAISVLDDLNCNNEMDMFLKFPKEGYGFSLNPDNKLRAPKFKECSFELNQSHFKITIHLKYPRKKK